MWLGVDGACGMREEGAGGVARCRQSETMRVVRLECGVVHLVVSVCCDACLIVFRLAAKRSAPPQTLANLDFSVNHVYKVMNEVTLVWTPGTPGRRYNVMVTAS